MKRGISFAIAACVAVVACLHGDAIYAAESTNEKPLRIAVYVGDGARRSPSQAARLWSSTRAMSQAHGLAPSRSNQAAFSRRAADSLSWAWPP